MTKKIPMEAGLLFDFPGLSRKSQITMTMDEFNSWLDYEVEEYTGGLVEGVRQGHGTGRWPDGKEYVGQWQNGDRHGQGTVTWPNGQKYIGEWQGDFATGKAVLSKTDGSVYAGEFEDSQRHGIGTQAYPNGAVYTGGWKDDHPEGWGAIRTADGKQSIGRLGINSRHGRGVLFFENGHDDENRRIFWGQGELLEEKEWFTRDQAAIFIEESRRLGIPFEDGGSISNQEKIYVLDEISRQFLYLKEVSGLVVMAMLHPFALGLQADTGEDGELAGLLATGAEGIDAFSRERNLTPVSRERLLLWSEWSRSEERGRIERYLMETFIERYDE